MTINIGGKAPGFDLPTDGGGTLSLKDLKVKGHAGAVLAAAKAL